MPLPSWRGGFQDKSTEFLVLSTASGLIGGLGFAVKKEIKKEMGKKKETIKIIF